MIIKDIFESKNFDDLYAVTGKDITDEMHEDCFLMDRDFYDDDYIWDTSETKKVVNEFGQFCFVFIDRQENAVIGYSF